MNLVFDPVWPWSHLGAFLSSAGGAVLLALCLAGALTFALPILVHLRRTVAERRRTFRIFGLAVVALLVWVAFRGVGSSGGGLRGRLLGLGAGALFLVPLILVGLTVWTYLGVPGASRRRIAVVLVLRLAAFVLALLATLRPSLGFSDPGQTRTVLYVVLDYSESMTIQDAFDNKPRWDHVLSTLRKNDALFRQLQDDAKIDVVFYRFASDAAECQLDDPGKADGKTTDFGTMLRRLFESRDGQRRPRGLLVFSDGTDTGPGRINALVEAGRFRNLPCPIHTFAAGKTTTGDRQRDVVLTSLTPEPSPVMVKGKLTVRGTIDAYGFEGSRARIKLFLDDKEVAAKDEELKLTTGNSFKIETNAPATAGEVKVTVRVEDPRRDGMPLDGELTDKNNEMSTFLTVTKGGISVLLVDRQRAMEPQSIFDALKPDSRINLFPVWVRGDKPLDTNAGDLFRFDERQYDVIILGDVPAKLFESLNPKAVEEIKKLVFDKGSGLLMLGGYHTYSNGGWQNTALKELLPVELGAREAQIETKVKMVPTEAGLRRFSYVMRLGDSEKETEQAWESLPALAGMTRLGNPKIPTASVLAVSGQGGAGQGDPIMVAMDYGKGRTMAFAGDTTHRWQTTDEGLKHHARFWRQMVVWLAHQEEAEGNVWIKPDVRRLPAHSDLGFSVGLRNKGGVDLKDGTFKVEVIGPGDARTEVATARSGSETRGVFVKTDAPGEYRLIVHGEGKDPSGEIVSGEASARVIVYDDDLELTRRAADHDFLKKLATAGGGQFHRADAGELADFLRKMLAQPTGQGKQRLELYPDWRTTNRSPFFVGLLVAFVVLLGAEWVLRRRWGLA
jgi:uncharacterized membrane protein